MRYAVGIPIISGTKNSTFNGEDWTTVIAAEIMNIDEKEGG